MAAAPVAILSALAQEQQGLLEMLDARHVVQRGGRAFEFGFLHGQPVVLALSRIGKVAAATTTTTLIEAFGVRRIVLTGVAGALSSDLQIGDIAVATGFVQHDMDASPLFARFEVPLYGRTQFPCDADLSVTLVQACQRAAAMLGTSGTAAGITVPSRTPMVHHGLLASGDRFVATAPQAVAIGNALLAGGMRAIAVEMEGAAVAQVCHDFGVAFAAVRPISDTADDRAAGDFNEFVTHVAGRTSCAIIGQLMRLL